MLYKIMSKTKQYSNTDLKHLIKERVTRLEWLKLKNNDLNFLPLLFLETNSLNTQNLFDWTIFFRDAKQNNVQIIIMWFISTKFVSLSQFLVYKLSECFPVRISLTTTEMKWTKQLFFFFQLIIITQNKRFNKKLVQFTDV